MWCVGECAVWREVCGVEGNVRCVGTCVVCRGGCGV